MSAHTPSRFAGLLPVLLATLVLTSLATAQSNVRIMPLGDSITGSPGCWRALLWNQLRNAGFTAIDFVGTLPPQGCGVAYDGDNEGHGGFLVTNVADQNLLPGWLAATDPDIVMMHFGTNDVWNARTPAVILAAFSKLVDQMRASNPNMMILVAQIIPLNPAGCSDCPQRVVAFNAAIPAWAAGKSTAASPIVVVDQWTGFSTAADTSDGVHPNGTGIQKIANRWFPAVRDLLLGAPAPNFGLSASPSTLTINRGGASGTSAIAIARTGGFTGSVDLSASGLPGGVSASFSPDPTTGNSSNLTLTASATATVGTANITINGTGAPGTRTTTVSLTVANPQVPNFALSVSPANLTIVRGANGTRTVAITRSGGFTGSVDLSASALPAGVTASFSPDPTTANSSILTLTASATATVGVSNITISGVGTPGTRSTTLALTVANAQQPDFSLSVSPASLTINRGASGTRTVAIARTNGFTGSVDLSASGLPGGVTASFSPDPTTANSSVLTLAASSTATLGTANVTINGAGTPGTRSTTLALTVSNVAPTPCANPTAITLPFAQNGVGDFCFVTSGNIAFINSWNMQLVEVNGVVFTNVWSNAMPPRINGSYTIHYVANVPWAHFEASGTP